jgi:hypothetical protein
VKELLVEEAGVETEEDGHVGPVVFADEGYHVADHLRCGGAGVAVLLSAPEDGVDEEAAPGHLQGGKALDPLVGGLDPVAGLGLVVVHDHGVDAEAEAAYQKTEAIIGREPWLWVGLCDLYAASDRLEGAREYQEELLALSERRYVPPALIGYTYASLGDRDGALAWLKKAHEERDPEVRMVHWPVLDPLRSDPRFQALQRKMGLE